MAQVEYFVIRDIRTDSYFCRKDGYEFGWTKDIDDASTFPTYLEAQGTLVEYKEGMKSYDTYGKITTPGKYQIVKVNEITEEEV